jgi:VWFA-related protein
LGQTTAIIKGQPTKALDDAVYESAELLKDRGRDRRKVILLISDGVNGPKFNKHSYDTSKEDLLRNGITVYSVAASSSFLERKLNRLVEYPHATGGDAYFGTKREKFEELYARVTEQARHQYTLAYSPRGTDRASDYHTIEVRVERPGLSVTAREGYFKSGVPR